LVGEAFDFGDDFAAFNDDDAGADFKAHFADHAGVAEVGAFDGGSGEADGFDDAYGGVKGA
jgi:hypothetical protein